MMVWDFRPLMLTTNPTPQASCSNRGSYKPCFLGNPVKGSRPLPAPDTKSFIVAGRIRSGTTVIG